jgi:peptidoglycan DL-endopeptidase CwlO
MRWSVLVATLLAPVLLWAIVPVGSLADPSPGQLQSQINRKNSLIGGHKAHERVLTTDITAATKKIDSLQGGITTLSVKQDKLQTSLDAKRTQLSKVQANLRSEQARLTRLRARLTVVRKTLAARLVTIYKAGDPDLVSVVLSSHGFEDLLTQTEFMRRISHQDARIMDIVATAKTESTASAKELAKLEKVQAAVAKAIEQQRDQVSAARTDLVTQRDRLSSARSAKKQLLASSVNRRQELQDDVGKLRSQQAKIQAKLARASSTIAPGEIRHGSGGLIWPVNGPITSPFCESRAWESCHPGIDIGVPEGTPIRAAANGVVVLMQPEAASGGYGNYTCVQHTSTMSTCYAHQSRFATSMGAHVSQGQVIGYSGCTGRCFGPHLHFEVRINGSVVNPMNYL